ncbi:MAG: MgtC/SapB transporter [uncultured bacterium]|nr:MAG: MgtC/SapB transporter [uncultured bacterium]HBH18756.1 magnesium transporter MgtC [Cyanobacteria bacterium UBA9579]
MLSLDILGGTPLLDNINYDLVIRVLVSTILGFAIGIERELTNKSAGLRTHILVCLGSTVFTILSIYGFANITTPEGARIVQDPARIAAQILTGIGFIGGGAVLHHGVSVYGLTTAATLWLTASVGMAAGTGSYQVAILATILTLIILIVIRKLERGIISRHIRKGVRIKTTIISAAEYVSDIQDWFFKNFDKIVETQVSKSTREDDFMKIIFILDVYDSDPISKAYKKIKVLKNIESLTLQHVAQED